MQTSPRPGDHHHRLWGHMKRKEGGRADPPWRRIVAQGPHPPGLMVSRGAHPRGHGVCSHPAGALKILPQDGSIHCFPCPQICSRRTGAFLNFPPARANLIGSHWREIQKCSRPAGANLCMHLPGGSTFNVLTGQEQTEYPVGGHPGQKPAPGDGVPGAGHSPPPLS